jgi:hypothetical protein
MTVITATTVFHGLGIERVRDALRATRQTVDVAARDAQVEAAREASRRRLEAAYRGELS